MHQVYLGLGSNLGDREALMKSAIRLIGERVGKVIRQSSMVETEPWGFHSDNRFLNAVILCHTEKAPREVLAVTQQIERELGRQRKTPAGQPSTVNGQWSMSYADRPIDIDILLFDDLNISEPDLKIPHPLMQERDFVMNPLKQIAPELILTHK